MLARQMSTAVAALLILLSAASPATGQVAYKPTVPTSTVCGHCCHEGTFCEATSEATALARAAGGLNAGDVIPAGTAMTCFLRDRDQPGAVDGGLCIPSSGVLDITSFCSDLSGTPESHVVPTIYEAGLKEQENTCSPCCDGQFVCGFGLRCAKVDSAESRGGVCVPETASDLGFCSGISLSKETVSCEMCDAYTPVARQLLSQSTAPTHRRSLAQFGSFGSSGGSSGGGSQSSGGQGSSGGGSQSASTSRQSTPTPVQTSASVKTPAPTAQAARVSTPAATPALTAAATPVPTSAATYNQAYRSTPAPTPARTTPSFQQPFNPGNYPKPSFPSGNKPPFQNPFPPFQNPFPPFQNPYPPFKNPFPPFNNPFPPKAPGPKLG